jgi:hypothetical protein
MYVSIALLVTSCNLSDYNNTTREIGEYVARKGKQIIEIYEGGNKNTILVSSN